MIELLAPAGDYETFVIAIEAGADAVYFGGENFGARSFSKNFSMEEILKATNFAHLHGKKVYVTVNTIIFEEELDSLHKYIDELYLAKVDALIVQDFSVLKYVKERYPDFILHASTQLNVDSFEGAKILKQMGFSRVVVARETPKEEVEKIAQMPFEVEVFCQGALCYSSSGNCLWSSFVGGRSGNRGKCCGSCRKNYSLIKDGEIECMSTPLLSLKDLMTVEDISCFETAFVTSIKIEGRMKKPAYVYSAVKAYRHALDKNMLDKRIDYHDMVVTYNRKFTKGCFFHAKNEDRFNIQSVNHLGLKIGSVIQKNNRYIKIKLEDDLKLNDGIRLVSNDFETGFYVSTILRNGQMVKEAKSGDTVELPYVNSLQLPSDVYKTSSQALQNDALKLLSTNQIFQKVSFELRSKLNSPLLLIATFDGIKFQAIGNVLNDTCKKAIDKERIIDQLKKMGGTTFVVSQVKLVCDDIAFIPLPYITLVKQNIIEQLNAYLLNKVTRMNAQPIFKKLSETKRVNTQLVCFATTKEQYEYLQSFDVLSYPKEALDRLSDTSVYQISHNLSTLDKVSNGLISPYYNISNSESFKWIEKYSNSTIYLSLELSLERTIQLLKALESNSKVGLFVYGNPDMMISKNCLIANYYHMKDKGCGICKGHNFRIEDEFHNQMQIITNSTNDDCNLRILHFSKFNRIQYMSTYLKNGVNEFMIVFTDESLSEMKEVIESYNKALKGIEVDFKCNPYTEGAYKTNVE